MNLEQLRSFVEVARFGNFTRAAEELYLAQPSLSRQIAALEQDLGAELFHRARGGSTLTVAGESLLPLARRMLADAESVRRELAELAGLERGRVRLGATPTLCISLVAEVLSMFHAEHPAIELHLSEQGSRRLLDELAGGELDLALITTSDATTAERFTVTPLLVEELVVISSAAAPPVTTRKTIGLEEVARLPQIVFSSSYDLRSATDAAFRAADLTPEVVLEGAEMDAVLRFVERGLGVAIVPAMVLIDRPGLRSVRLDGPTLSRTISLARPADVTPTTAVEVMRHTITASATAFAAGRGRPCGSPVRATDARTASAVCHGQRLTLHEVLPPSARSPGGAVARQVVARSIRTPDRAGQANRQGAAPPTTHHVRERRHELRDVEHFRPGQVGDPAGGRAERELREPRRDLVGVHRLEAQATGNREQRHPCHAPCDREHEVVELCRSEHGPGHARACDHALGFRLRPEIPDGHPVGADHRDQHEVSYTGIAGDRRKVARGDVVALRPAREMQHDVDARERRGHSAAGDGVALDMLDAWLILARMPG